VEAKEVALLALYNSVYWCNYLTYWSRNNDVL